MLRSVTLYEALHTQRYTQRSVTHHEALHTTHALHTTKRYTRSGTLHSVTHEAVHTITGDREPYQG